MSPCEDKQNCTPSNNTPEIVESSRHVPWITVEEYNRQRRSGCGFVCQLGHYAGMVCNTVIYDRESHFCDLHYLTTFAHDD